MIFTSHETSMNNSSAMRTPGVQQGNGNRGLHVCMLAYAFYESDTRILQYATALTQRGDEVDVIALRRDDSFPEYELLDGVNVYRIQSRIVNEKGLLSYIWRIMRFLFRSTLLLHRKQSERSYDLV